MTIDPHVNSIIRFIPFGPYPNVVIPFAGKVNSVIQLGCILEGVISGKLLIFFHTIIWERLQSFAFCRPGFRNDSPTMPPLRKRRVVIFSFQADDSICFLCKWF